MASLQDNKQVNSEESEAAIHEFSSPWEDSDLVLVVENQNLHVHSIILKMASPVFKAMLSDELKEKNQREISIPGKEAEQFVDFLKLFYPQFDYHITLENMEHIYLLSDEYQVKTVTTLCFKELQHVEITNTNVSNVMVLAQKMNCDKVRQKCFKILNNMTVAALTSSKGFMTLDKESLHQTIVSKAKRLEECLKQIQPQFVGVLDCLLYIWGYIDTKRCDIKGKPTRCPVHMIYKVIGSIAERLKCPACVKALEDMASCSKNYDYQSEYRRYSDNEMYFDDNIVTALREMVDILKTE